MMLIINSLIRRHIKRSLWWFIRIIEVSLLSSKRRVFRPRECIRRSH
jgi:hypothetical protein